jgi:4-carboxymuconolactone decarboxylase
MMTERMPPLDPAAMSAEQSAAAAALSAGPRGGVRGPFIALLRSPQLMDRLQKVGEYLRYQSSLEPRLSEFVMLVVARRWTQQFEWFVHYPLALKAGVAPAAVEGLAQGRRPPAMAEDEALAYDLCDELLRTQGLCEATYRAAIERFGERGVVDLVGLIGYFITVSMVLNVAHTPPPQDPGVRPLGPLPL